MKILVVDIETTGFYPKNDLIVEIAAAVVDTKTKDIKLVFEKAIKDPRFDADKHGDSWIFENSSLTVEDVENAESIEAYREELQALFDEYLMTAYNKKFDLGFLREAGFTIKDTKCLMESAKVHRTGRKYSVEVMYNQFFMDGKERYVEEHRAGADTIDEAKILLHLVKLKEETLGRTEPG
tara:strand:+ start:121665 stop:122207 length:543 start_codon:yes stop_codon:yes gene_type:complete